MKYFFYCVTVFLFLFSSAHAQPLSDDIKTILKFQDERTLGPGNELLDFLNSGDESVVTAALYALANIADSTTIDTISVQLMNNTSPKVRSMAAFALGQIGTGLSAEYLQEAGKKEKDVDVLVAILENIGKTGDEEALNKIVPLLIDDARYHNAVAMAVARFALRNIKNQNSIRHLEALFAYGRTGIEKYLAYALWRIRDRDLLIPERIHIMNLIRSNDPETRAYSVYALNAIKEPSDIPVLIDMFESENDWRVKVNILNTLGGYTLDSIGQYTEQISGVFGRSLADPSDHVKIAALNADGRLFSQYKIPESGDKPVVIPGTKVPMMVIESKGWYSSQVFGAAIDAYAQIMKDRSENVLWEEFYYYTSVDNLVDIINAFSYFENGDIIGKLRDSISVIVMRFNEVAPNTTGEMIPNLALAKIYRAYIETALNLLPNMKSEESLNLARLSFIEFADSRKPDIVYYSLQGLQSDQMKARQDWMFENKEVLNFEYAGLEYPKNVDDMTLFADAFGELQDTVMLPELRKNLGRDNYDLAVTSAGAIEKITGEKITVNPADYSRHTDFDWDYLNANQTVTVILNTSEGEIEIELYPDVAPFTVMNFLKLAEQNYFDATEFHRVIGNFVIQGGDPTSTGFGGPGYSIRGEYSPLPYERGTLGMASAGKDTEGSQFFITHSRQPHLDSKYTIFGKVVNGMDVVDRILIGYTLNDVIIIRN